jgi:hypothetical protein
LSSKSRVGTGVGTLDEAFVALYARPETGWLVCDTLPACWDELTHSAIDTNSPFTLSFENDQRGKTVYFAIRWENTRGEKGPCSEILNTIIP